jgi:two-component system CheB/CheR fusion protein
MRNSHTEHRAVIDGTPRPMSFDTIEKYDDSRPPFISFPTDSEGYDGLDPAPLARLDTLCAAVPGIVWEAWGEPDSALQHINFVSDYITAMLGYSIEEWLSTPNFWLTIIHPDDRERAARESMDIFKSGVPGVIEFRWITKEGRAIWVEARSRAIHDGSGKPIGMRGITFDISRHKEAEAQLERAKEEAETANHTKDQFLAMLSHELRTPLTPVLTIAQMLESDPGLSEELRSLIEIIRRNAELEARLIDDLLDLNRILSGKLPLNLDTVDAHALLHNVVETCQSDIDGAGLRLTLDQQATRTAIHADPARIQQILWNLLKNAVKFTPSGGSITIRTSNDADMRLRIDVQDTGVGIERSMLPKIFQAFEQGGPTVTRTFGGLGLGLAISRAIAEMHGARLSADSLGRGEGATLTLVINTMDAPESIPVKVNGDRVNNEHTPCRILFVDDNEDTGRANKMLLERCGYQVRVANSVASAREWIDTQAFDLIISDTGLSDGSGFDVIAYIRAVRPGIKAVALSGFGMEEDIHRSLEGGFHEHLTKPVAFNRLLEVITKLMVQE